MKKLIVLVGKTKKYSKKFSKGKFKKFIFLLKITFYINPIEPAVNPIIRKNENSARSLGNEFTISFN